jgi:hypothetical protein
MMEPKVVAARTVAALLVVLYVFMLSAPSAPHTTIASRDHIPSKLTSIDTQTAHEDGTPQVSSSSHGAHENGTTAERSAGESRLDHSQDVDGPGELPQLSAEIATLPDPHTTKPSSGRYAALRINRSTDFFAACTDYDADNRLGKWSLGQESRMPFTGVGARGDELMCMKGRQLFHLDNSEATWPQVSSGTHKTARLPPVAIRPLAQHALRQAEEEGTVRYHAHTAVVTTALLSMYHLLNDFLVPLHATLRLLFRNASMAPPIQRGALEIVLMYLNGQSRGHDSDAATIVFANAMVPADGGSLRLLIDPRKADNDATLHCYCRGLLMPGIALLSMGPTARLIEGDRLRRAGTNHIKQKLNEHFGFAAYGTVNVPSSQWRDYGLWNTTPRLSTNSTVSAPPRLLFMLRNKTRIVGNAEEIARIASTVGFDVEVMTPEHEPVERQARAARYAHVVMAIHGQALTWMMLMDTVVATHCRQVVELRHYGRKLRRVHNVYELVAADNYIMYRNVGAVDAVFDAKYVSSQNGEKALLMRKPFPHRYRGFSWQTAFYSVHEVRHVLQKAFEHARMCDRLQGAKYVLTSHDVSKSDYAWGR